MAETGAQERKPLRPAEEDMLDGLKAEFGAEFEVWYVPYVMQPPPTWHARRGDRWWHADSAEHLAEDLRRARGES